MPVHDRGDDEPGRDARSHFVPAWHPEGGGPVGEAAGARAAAVPAPVPLGVVLATALVLLGLFLLQVGSDGWLGAGMCLSGITLLVHEVWHWHLPGR